MRRKSAGAEVAWARKTRSVAPMSKKGGVDPDLAAEELATLPICNWLIRQVVALSKRSGNGAAMKTSSEIELAVEASPSLAESLSDDECIERLAQIVRDGDEHKLQEAAMLIARLAVVIE
jgi:hypothetical protein